MFANSIVSARICAVLALPSLFANSYKLFKEFANAVPLFHCLIRLPEFADKATTSPRPPDFSRILTALAAQKALFLSRLESDEKYGGVGAERSQFSL